MALTAEQRLFAAELDWHSCVVAIPGSGKTTTATHLMAAIVARGETVLGLSFTRQGAIELRERALAMAGAEGAKLCTVGTIHSITRRALAALPGSPIRGLELAKEGEILLWMQMAIEQNHLVYNNESRAWFEAARARATDPFGIEAARALPANDRTRQERIEAAAKRQKVVQDYEKILRRYRKYDFPLLLQIALRLAQKGQRLFVADHILVDEFQDVDEIQLQLLLAHAKWSLIHVVGDDDQSIYGFRQGLGYEAFQILQATLGAKRLILSNNFRSRPEILQVAQQVIERNKARIPKQLQATRGAGGRVRLVEWENYGHENQGIGRLVGYAVDRGAQAVAIIARFNRDLIEVQATLTQLGVAFRRIGKKCKSFWNRKPCVIALALLRSLAEPQREIAGPELATFWCGARATDVEVLRNAAAGDAISSAFAEYTNSPRFSVESRAAIEVVSQLLSKAGYPRVPESADDIDQAVHAVFEGLKHATEHNKTRSGSKGEPVRSYLDSAERAIRGMTGSLAQRLAIVERAKENSNSAKVSLLTMHASKGLEFDEVFIIGAADSIIPGRAVTEAEIAEERRLAYVAVTRAKDALTLSYARRYLTSGFSRTEGLSRLLFVPKLPCPEYGADYRWLFNK